MSIYLRHQIFCLPLGTLGNIRNRTARWWVIGFTRFKLKFALNRFVSMQRFSVPVQQFSGGMREGAAECRR